MKKTRLYFLSLFLLCGSPQAQEPSEIFSAIRIGDEHRVKGLLQAGLSANHRDSKGNSLLLLAAMSGDTETMKLLLQRGADVNAANQHGVTPLMAAAGDVQKIQLLLEHGADVKARSKLGNTPLILAARAAGSQEAVKRLLERGAEVNATNIHGTHAIMTAAASGDIGTVKLLLAHGADVNSHSRGGPEAALWGGGRSPLMWAALRNDIEMMKLLLEAGAEVNAQEGFGTPLTQAAWMDRVEAARLLLKHGADVSAKEQFSGYTALHWAASTENGDAALTKLLLKHGADPNASGGEPVDAFMGEAQTPLMLALKRGETPITRALKEGGAEWKGESPREGGARSKNPPPALDAIGIRLAIGRALPALQETALKSKDSFLRHSSKQDCISCHQQNSPLMAMAVARKAGAAVDRDAEEAILELVRRDNSNFGQITTEATFHPEPAHDYGYDLLSFGLQNEPPSLETDEIVHHLLVIQGPDGQWFNNLPRPPIQTSDVGATALAIYGLQQYGSPALKGEIEERLERARKWLRRVQASNTEEKVYQLLGLRWAGEEKTGRLAKRLLSDQRPDGGWGQLPGLESDAYATGQALFALHTAGLKTTTPEFRNGVRFLVETQEADGTWRVRRRAFPFQPTMQSGYSHGRDSWVSSAGSSWAVMALALSLEANFAGVN